VLNNLVATQYVEAWALQTSGGALDVTLSNFTLIKLDSGRVGTGIGAQAFNSNVQSIPDNADTAATFDSEVFDTDGFHDTSSNTSRMTIPAGLGGKYLILGGGRLPPATSLQRQLTLRKNGTTGLRGAFGDTQDAGAGGIDRDQQVMTIADLVAGDFVELVVYQNGTGSKDFGHASSANVQGFLTIMRLDSLPSAGGGIVQVKTANLASDHSTTAATVQDSGLSLAFTPLFADSILHINVDGECQVSWAAGSLLERYQYVSIYNSTNSVEVVGSYRGGRLVAASAALGTHFNAIGLKGTYTVNSTAARTFKLQHFAGIVTNLQSTITGTRAGGVTMTIAEVRP
jgi:hypothetical protein